MERLLDPAREPGRSRFRQTPIQAETGGQHSACPTVDGLECLQGLDAIHARHVQVDDDEVRAPFLWLRGIPGHCSVAGTAFVDDVAELPEDIGRNLPDGILVVDDEDAPMTRNRLLLAVDGRSSCNLRERQVHTEPVSYTHLRA